MVFHSAFKGLTTVLVRSLSCPIAHISLTFHLYLIFNAPLPVSWSILIFSVYDHTFGPITFTVCLFVCLFVISAVTLVKMLNVTTQLQKQALENMVFLSADEAACWDVKHLLFDIRTYIVITAHNRWVSEPHSGERSLQYLLTYFLTYLLIYLLTYLLTNLLTCLLT